MSQYLSPKHIAQKKVSWKRRVASFGNLQLREVDLLELFKMDGYRKGLRLLFHMAASLKRSRDPKARGASIQLAWRCLNGTETRRLLRQLERQCKAKARPHRSE